MNAKELLIGDLAPELRLGTVFKGQGIDTFDAGTVYVIVGWSTWCGPCINTIPHLTQLQKTFPDVKIVGVAINGDEGKVAEIVAEKGDEMDYIVASDGPVENGHEQDGGWVANHWFKASYTSGVPAAFIVDGTGRLAWTGDPVSMDDILPRIQSGEWDLDEHAKQHRSALENNKVREGFALKDIINTKAKAGDRRGMIEAFNEAFAAHRALERQWWDHKLYILLQIDQPAALIYADDLVMSAEPDNGDSELCVGQMLVAAAIDEDTNTLAADRKDLFDAGLGYLLACERRLSRETPSEGA
ncbi:MULTISPECIES: TlpA disulfide reductase family protein [Rhizobium]|uniref:TlpA family protein disulfide reductase n=1 Tax=Rhizobium TaxID=379 RepID=UPI001C83326F|nr:MULTISPECIES: TlpA disulfide reductase family protein [Rhizobium]MBX4870264.1 TlpA family protein disulfide reductase [Rhizobium bangladeshense]MBX5213733.1 TlpA family protein disulfide reductase [Rhizobium sp. NLR9a]MBX5219116.1 TlpA family protein disulfide reductase [Rhizobium sp. NLR8a]MBX5232950.1 TlpA family protein disulfide reductase [Rhizobium sp. NLR4a]MBX5246103.1 TlpA family protein disulfide reductase [Rhizobium sp. NLR3b]